MDGNVDLYNININVFVMQSNGKHKTQHSVAQFGHDCVKGYILSRYIYFLHIISACIHLLVV